MGKWYNNYFLNILPSQNILISVNEFSPFGSQMNVKIYVFFRDVWQIHRNHINSSKCPQTHAFLVLLQNRVKKCPLSLVSSHHIILAALFRGCRVEIASSPKCDLPSLDPDWNKLLFTTKFAFMQLKPDNLRSQLSQISLTCFTLLGHIRKNKDKTKKKKPKTNIKKPQTHNKPHTHKKSPAQTKINKPVNYTILSEQKWVGLVTVLKKWLLMFQEKMVLLNPYWINTCAWSSCWKGEK